MTNSLKPEELQLFAYSLSTGIVLGAPPGVVTEGTSGVRRQCPSGMGKRNYVWD